jgi:hypothetical protein
MNIGNLEVSTRLTAVRRDGGQVSGDPSGAVDQSWARMRAPVPPPSARKVGIDGWTLWQVDGIGSLLRLRGGAGFELGWEGHGEGLPEWFCTGK